MKWACGIEWNKAELDRRIACSEFTSAQCLSRLTNGMPNHYGPPNGPLRPTLADKWRLSVHGASAEEIERHVAELREHVAVQVAQQLGLLKSASASAKEAPSKKRTTAALASVLDEATPAAKRLRMELPAGSTWRCGLRITGQPGDPAPSMPGGTLSTKIFVVKAKAMRQNKQELVTRIQRGELSVNYALSCMRVGGPLRRYWAAASDTTVQHHIDGLCSFLRELKRQAEAGTYDGAADIS